jgi:hypothetical protein
LLPGLEGPPVWILDTSALVSFKELISVAVQWEAFKQLEQLVDTGRIAMPRQVIKEVSEIAHPDLPGAWAPGVRSRLHYPLDVEYQYLQVVMREAGDVVDASKATEEADPYVVAQALHFRSQGINSIVVTDDQVDRLPIRIALTTACARLGVSCVDSRAFLASCDIQVRHGDNEGR